MERKVYFNKYNIHKIVEVVRYKCGHYYVAQYIFHSPEQSASGKEVMNYTGTTRNRRCRRRWSVKRVNELLADYVELYQEVS